MEYVRSGPLCWAQHWFWLSDLVVANGDSRDRMIYAQVGLGKGFPAPTVRRAVTELMDQHEALRTVYRRGEDGLPTQVVLDGVEPRLILVDLDQHDASKGVYDYLPARFDLATELTFTALAGMQGDTVCVLYLAVHRLAVDGVSLALLCDQCGELIDSTPLARPGRQPRWHPLDQATAETADLASGAADRSARYWEQELATGPHASLPIYWDGGGAPSYETRTPVAAERLAATAQRYGVSIPTVIQALLALMCAGWTGHPFCAIGSVTANRVRKFDPTSVGRYASMVRVVLQVDPAMTFQAFVREVHRKLLSAYSRGAYDVGEMTMREVRHSARIGARITCSIFFEYHYYAGPEGNAGPDGNARQHAVPVAGEAVDTSPVVQQTELPNHVPQLRVEVVPAGDILDVAVRCPSHLLDASGAKDFLTQFRELVDLLATGDPPVDQLLATVDLPAPWAAGNWASVRHAWVNLDEIARLLREHRNVATATVTVERLDAADRTSRLVAHVVPRTTTLSASDLDEHMRAVVSNYPSAMVPHEYVIAGSPAPGSPSEERQPPDRPEELVLVDVFRACHRGRSPQLADSYAEAGGEFFRIPDMLDGLAQAGLAGLEWNDFVGFAPMRALAAKLTKQ